MKERSTCHHLLVKDFQLKEGSRRMMVCFRRKRLKINTSLMVVMLILLGVTTVRRKFIPKKCVLIG